MTSQKNLNFVKSEYSEIPYIFHQKPIEFSNYTAGKTDLSNLQESRPQKSDYLKIGHTLHMK